MRTPSARIHAKGRHGADTCIHSYICEPPTGPTSKGRCRHCGVERVFQNFVGKEKDDIAPSVKQKAKRDAEREALPPQPCIICGSEFVPGRTTQVLCGDAACQRAYDASWKRRNWQQGKGGA